MSDMCAKAPKVQICFKCSFIDHASSFNMAGYWPRSFLRVYGRQKRTWPISSHPNLTLIQCRFIPVYRLYRYVVFLSSMTICCRSHLLSTSLYTFSLILSGFIWLSLREFMWSPIFFLLVLHMICSGIVQTSYPDSTRSDEGLTLETSAFESLYGG